MSANPFPADEARSRDQTDSLTPDVRTAGAADSRRSRCDVIEALAGSATPVSRMFLVGLGTTAGLAGLLRLVDELKETKTDLDDYVTALHSAWNKAGIRKRESTPPSAGAGEQTGTRQGAAAPERRESPCP